IGGDDTLGYGHRLGAEGVPLVAIPKTMDNDVQGTEYCIGFSSAVTRARELINRQRTTLGSHERIGVFRIFGRNSGYTAWYAAYVTSARCVIPEASFDLDQLAELLMEDRRATPSSSRRRAPSGAAARSARRARPMPTATDTRPMSAAPWPRSCDGARAWRPCTAT